MEGSPPLFPLYPWFGGKSKIADLVWQRFGDVDNYIEPFYGGGAIHLLRPHWDWQRNDWRDERLREETINDADGLLVNFWRAVHHAPDEVAAWADYPVVEADLTARHIWLTARREQVTERCLADPDWYDAKIAGWWLWGIGIWIGGHWCMPNTGPWVVRDGKLQRVDDSSGVVWRRPHLGNRAGIHKLMGKAALADILEAYAARMRHVRICCGDWERVVGSHSVTTLIGLTGVLLDPPYSEEAGRTPEIYSEEDLAIAHAAREWAIRAGDDPMMRIALCGYAGEHDAFMSSSWECVRWQTQGGYANLGNGRGRINRMREVVWFSPHCLRGDAVAQQLSLWELAEEDTSPPYPEG